MAACSEECEDANTAAQERSLLSGRVKDELNKSASSLKKPMKRHLVEREFLDADLVSLCVGCDSLKNSSAARDAELEGVWMTVAAKSGFIELLKIGSEQPKSSFEKGQAATETLLPETEMQPDVKLSEISAHREYSRDEVGHLPSNRGILRVELKTNCRQLSAISTEIGTVGGQFNEQIGRKEDEKQKRTDVQYEPDGAKRRAFAVWRP